MKAQHLIFGAACVQAALAVAVPHGFHVRDLHHKRSIVTSTAVFTEIVTVTDHNAVVWVDHKGQPVLTEHKTRDVPPTTTTSIPASTTASTSVSATATSVASSAQSSPTPVTKDTGKNQGELKGFGVVYDTYTGDWHNPCRSTIDSDFKALAEKGVSIIRTYDGCYIESINAAKAHNLKLMIGITSFLDFTTKFQKLQDDVKSTQAKWDVIDTVFIGNELVQNGTSVKDVVYKVESSRATLLQAGYKGNVVTVDTYGMMIAHPDICGKSDYCAANAHAYFDTGALPTNAGTIVRKALTDVAAANPGKQVRITESGWPHGGGDGRTTPENQKAAMSSITKEFAKDPGNMFLFMAFDTKYKKEQPPIEMNFGIFDADHYSGFN